MEKRAKNKIVKVIMLIIFALIILSISTYTYGVTTTNSIGTNVQASFDDETGALTISSTSETGTIDKEALNIFKKSINVDSVRTITFSNTVNAPEDSSKLFSDFSSAESIDVTNLNASGVKDMSFMFGSPADRDNDMAWTQIIGLGSFDTSSATNMTSMFQRCSSLTSLDLSNFTTTNVTDMNSMFYNCTSLTSLDVSSFNTSNVTNMMAMFGSGSEPMALTRNNRIKQL